MGRPMQDEADEIDQDPPDDSRKPGDFIAKRQPTAREYADKGRALGSGTWQRERDRED